MDVEMRDRDPRLVAVELAAKVRFLREEYKEGRGGDSSELLKKVKELADLFKVDASVSKVDFLIFDFDEKPGVGIGGVPQENCLRIVQIWNPNRSRDADNEASFSLLPGFMKRKGQLDVRVSSVTSIES